MTADLAPLVRTVTAQVVASAVGADAAVAVVAPFAGTVTAVTYIPVSTITGADTNSRTLAVTNKGQAGAGSTAVASKAFTNTVNATGYDETAITLNGTAANLVVADGDVLACTSTHVGTGIADPGGVFRVTFKRDGAS